MRCEVREREGGREGGREEEGGGREEEGGGREGWMVRRWRGKDKQCYDIS